jgi:hypothetical protein
MFQVKWLTEKLLPIKVFRIKGIPGPTGTIRGETGLLKVLNQILK